MERVILLLVAIAVIIVVSAAITLYLLGSKQGGTYAPNINVSDVQSATPGGPAYVVIQSDNKTDLSHNSAIAGSGYMYVSISEFNSTVPHSSTYPVLITSVLYIMSNSSYANQTEQSVISTAQQSSPLTSGLSYNSVAGTRYSFNNKAVTIYETSSLASLNASYTLETGQYPLYTYTSVFTYGDYVGFVVVDGYANLSSNYSNPLAEALFRKLAR